MDSTSSGQCSTVTRLAGNSYYAASSAEAVYKDHKTDKIIWATLNYLGGGLTGLWVNGGCPSPTNYDVLQRIRACL
jgi:hypothetical protein